MSLDAGAGQVCYTVEFSNIEIRAVKVVRYGTGEEVQKLYDEAPTDGPRVEGCKPEAAEGIIAEMTEHAERFYVYAQSYDGREEIAGPMKRSTD